MSGYPRGVNATNAPGIGRLSRYSQDPDDAYEAYRDHLDELAAIRQPSRDLAVQAVASRMAIDAAQAERVIAIAEKNTPIDDWLQLYIDLRQG